MSAGPHSNCPLSFNYTPVRQHGSDGDIGWAPISRSNKDVCTLNLTAARHNLVLSRLSAPMGFGRVVILDFYHGHCTSYATNCAFLQKSAGLYRYLYLPGKQCRRAKSFTTAQCLELCCADRVGAGEGLGLTTRHRSTRIPSMRREHLRPMLLCAVYSQVSPSQTPASQLRTY